jgi:hypothetical protein
MVEILNFKEESNNHKIKCCLTNLNVWGLLISHCGRDMNTGYTHLTG